LVKAGKRKWEKFLHVHKLGRPETYQRRLEIFARADRFAGSPPAIHAKSRLAVTRAKQLQLLQTQINEYRQEIRRLFAQHPDAALFESLPGAGDKIAPRLLSEIGDDRVLFPDAQGLQCLAGTAPVSFQSGQIQHVHLRRQCNKSLRNVVHLWANWSREFCPWAATYYTALRGKGKSHACASRALGHSQREILRAKSPSSASTVKMEVEGRKGDTILTGTNELYHDEAFRAKAAPPQPIFIVNNFFAISICKPENFLKFPKAPYNLSRRLSRIVRSHQALSISALENFVSS
jgi:hypothetical protein